MESLKIEYLPVNEILPYKGNARKHGETDINAIMESIIAFGFNDPIAIWGEENLIIEGHGRLIAAKNLEMETVPCIRLDELTEEERKAYALAHNKIAELSAWDFEMLEQELDSIEMEMENFGFDMGDAIDLTGIDKDENEDEEDENTIKCHCPKCGFYFEVKR